MLVTLMILFCICTVSPMILKLYSLFAAKFANFNVLETSIYMFRYGLSNNCSLKFLVTLYCRPQRSWGKVIFSQASVILSRAGDGCLLSDGVPGLGGLPGVGGVPGWGGCLVWGPGLGGALWRPPGMATAASGTHPTGMHSCLNVNWRTVYFSDTHY